MNVDSEAGKLAVETLMIRFNHEKVRPPLELEGQGGLLMHVRRAIDFVANNPVGDMLWPGAQDWAKNNQAEARATAAQVAEQHDDPSIQLLGTIGAAVADAAHSGSSIDEAFSGGNVDIPKDPDAISEYEGGTPGKRSLTDIGNGRRMIDSFGSSVRYTPG
ncbi:MAG: hypothetical protein EBX57_07605, partial [Betaproteobacteria bacterium]|nr:hypothetical protein [Betaproteobacteria bacterium]